MGGWMDGWVDGWMDGWMDKQNYIQTEQQTDRRMGACQICSITTPNSRYVTLNLAHRAV